MATYYARAGGGNWTAAATWSLTSGGGATGSTPTAADEVIFDANSGAVTINSGSVARLWTVNGYTGTITHSAIALSLGDGTAGTGNKIIDFATSGWTYTLSNATTSSITCLSSSATQQTVKTNGKTLGNITFQGGGNYLLADALTSTGTLTFTQGTFNTGNFAMTLAALNYGNATTRTLTLGSSALSLSATSGAFSGTASTNLTISSNTAIVTCTGTVVSTNNLVSLGGKNWQGMSLVLTGGGQGAINTGGTSAIVKDLTITGTANQTNSYRLSTNFTVSGAFTATGDSAINRLLIYGITLGTANTITAATVSLTNVDFQDITGAGAASPFTGTILGDRGGNSGITFTTPATQTRDSTNAAAWSVAARWTSRVPLPQDDVVINGSSGSISTTDVLAMGKSIDFTGYTSTITQTTNASTFLIFGGITLASGMTWGSPANTFNLDFVGRGTHTITSNGKDMFPAGSNQAIQVNSAGGTYTLGDAFSQLVTTANLSFRVLSGSFSTANYNMSIGRFVRTGTLTASVTWGTSTVTMLVTAATPMLSITTSGLTWSGASATFIIAAASANVRSVDLQGVTIGTLQYNVANSLGGLTITSSGTITNLNIGSGRLLTVTAGQTLTTAAFTPTGVNNGYQYLQSVAGAYVSIPDSAATSWSSDFDYRFKLAADAWNQGNMNISGKQASSSSQTAWNVVFNATSKQPQLQVSSSGAVSTTVTSSAAVPFADGADGWLRVTWRASDGRVQFFTSSDTTNDPSSVTWTQLGTNQTANVGSIFDSTASIIIGAANVTNTPTFTGKFYRAQYRNNILDDGTGIQLDVNFVTKAFGQDTFTESSSNAATVTINGGATAGDGRIQINSSSAGSAGTIAKSTTPNISGDYLVIKDSTVSTTTPGYAGANSVNVSGNTNWTFTSPPNGNFFLMF